MSEISRLKPRASVLDDVQGRADHRRMPIDRVGVRGLRQPVRVRDRSGAARHTVARVSMDVNLRHDVKGTHMSRFLELLQEERDLTLESFGALLARMTQRLEASSGRIQIEFPFFITKRAPVSKVESLMDYEVAFVGEIHDGAPNLWLKAQVPVTSLCPCSKKISDYGAHNQRSHITIEAELDKPMWIEELIEIAESEASSELYGVLKRPDEKFVTERAYDNPKFVEDVVRDVAARLSAEPRIASFTVECENFESIHNHSAFARISQDRLNR